MGRPNLTVRNNDVLQAEFDENGEQIVNNGLALHQGGTLRQVKTSYTTALAVQRPRTLKLLQRAVLDEAELAGEEFFYSWTVNSKDGKKSLVEGTSIDGAMIMVRNWGNCAVEMEIAEDAPSHWVFKASFVDLETGFTDTRLYRQRKAERHGKFDEDRAMDIAFQIGQSKAKRNVVVACMPKWLVSAAMKKAQSAAEGAYRDIAKELPKVLKSFAKLGIDEVKLVKKIGAPVEQWTPRDLMTLVAIGRAVRDRQTTLEQEFSDDALGIKVEQAPAPATATAHEPTHAETEQLQPDEELDEGSEDGKF